MARRGSRPLALYVYDFLWPGTLAIGSFLPSGIFELLKSESPALFLSKECEF